MIKVSLSPVAVAVDICAVHLGSCCRRIIMIYYIIEKVSVGVIYLAVTVDIAYKVGVSGEAVLCA